MHKPLVLIILDGWGHREETDQNAIAAASTPVWERLYTTAAHTLLQASGGAVGLPEGQMGNSEVGHLCIGGGRIVHQSIVRINQALASGAFARNAAYCEAVTAAARAGAAVHIMGLLSPGGVHSHEEHIHAALDLAAQKGAKRIFLHAFLDGRDTPPRSAGPSLQKLHTHCQALAKKAGKGAEIRIASLCGRYFAMDRDRRWERTRKAYRLLCHGEAAHSAAAADAALAAAYARGESDEFVAPTLILGEGETAPAVIEDNDAVLFMNFRADRARQLSSALARADFQDFDRQGCPPLPAQRFVMTTPYGDALQTACAFPSETLSNTLGEYIASRQLPQLRIAETEKYPHVTYFFNGGREEPFAGEERILIPSPAVATYDLQPEMSAPEVTQRLTAAVSSGKYALIVCNYANGDMVGHTGIMSAAIQAVETIDHCLGLVLEAVEAAKGECLITADHGNCEQMTDPASGQQHTAHTCEAVPFLYIGSRKVRLAEGGGLSGVAAAALTLLGLPVPQEMSGQPFLYLD